MMPPGRGPLRYDQGASLAPILSGRMAVSARRYARDRARAGHEQQDQHDLAELRLVEPAVELPAEPASGEERGKAERHQPVGVGRDFAAAAEPEAAHDEARDTDRLEHRALAVARAAAQLAPDRGEHAGEPVVPPRIPLTKPAPTSAGTPPAVSGFMAGRAGHKDCRAPAAAPTPTRRCAGSAAVRIAMPTGMPKAEPSTIGQMRGQSRALRWTQTA